MAISKELQERDKKMGRPKLFTSPDELQEKIDEYFRNAEEKGDPYTMSGLALALGMDRDTLLRYSKQEEFYGTVQTARDRVNAELERRLLKSGTPTIGLIFALKNNAGWVDKQEIETTCRVTLSVPDDVEDTAQEA